MPDVNSSGVIQDPWASLGAVVWPALVAEQPFVEVPAGLFLSLRRPNHPMRWPWIPGIDDRPGSCGEFERIETRYAERWCLLDRDHEGPHGWEPTTRSDDLEVR